MRERLFPIKEFHSEIMRSERAVMSSKEGAGMSANREVTNVGWCLSHLTGLPAHSAMLV